jgi:glycosyltransferase involved in cell wall biosynthesis
MKPLINIVTRCSRKDKFLKNCLPSIQSQTYENYHHVITYETEELKNSLLEYVDPGKTTWCKVFPTKKIKGLYKSFYYKQHGLLDDVDKIDAKLWTPDEEGVSSPNWKGGRTKFMHFPYNLYLIRAEKKIREGWVIYLDDDNQLYKDTALEELANGLVDEDTLYFFRIVKPSEWLPHDYVLNHSAIPKGEQPPALGVGFTGHTIIFHSKYLEHTAWDEWSGSDWKTVQSLWYSIPKHNLINKPIIKITPVQGYGE